MNSMYRCKVCHFYARQDDNQHHNHRSVFVNFAEFAEFGKDPLLSYESLFRMA